jgi:hypothetical protein
MIGWLGHSAQDPGFESWSSDHFISTSAARLVYQMLSGVWMWACDLWTWKTAWELRLKISGVALQFATQISGIAIQSPHLICNLLQKITPKLIRICEELLYKTIFFNRIVWKISKIATHRALDERAGESPLPWASNSDRNQNHWASMVPKMSEWMQKVLRILNFWGWHLVPLLSLTKILSSPQIANSVSTRRP